MSFVAFVFFTAATEQSVTDMSKCYGRHNGNTDYQEKKVTLKVKVSGVDGLWRWENWWEWCRENGCLVMLGKFGFVAVSRTVTWCRVSY